MVSNEALILPNQNCRVSRNCFLPSYVMFSILNYNGGEWKKYDDSCEGLRKILQSFRCMINDRKKKNVAASSFDLPTSELWAQHASTAPRCLHISPMTSKNVFLLLQRLPYRCHTTDRNSHRRTIEWGKLTSSFLPWIVFFLLTDVESRGIEVSLVDLAICFSYERKVTIGTRKTHYVKVNDLSIRSDRECCLHSFRLVWTLY